MAKPIVFQPLPVDPHLELMRRLDAAPREHAEALLVAYDILQSAHDKGLLDAVHGLVGAKDTIFATLARYAKTPEGIAGIRNLLEGAKIFTAIDPETLSLISTAVAKASAQYRQEQTPPSLLEISRRAMGEDSRRALSFMTLTLSSIGKALKG